MRLANSRWLQQLSPPEETWLTSLNPGPVAVVRLSFGAVRRKPLAAMRRSGYFRKAMPVATATARLTRHDAETLCEALQCHTHWLKSFSTSASCAGTSSQLRSAISGSVDLHRRVSDWFHAPVTSDALNDFIADETTSRTLAAALETFNEQMALLLAIASELGNTDDADALQACCDIILKQASVSRLIRIVAAVRQQGAVN